LEHWGTQFARIVSSRNQGQSDFALDLIDLLQQKAAEFNEVVLKEFKFSLQVTAKGEDVEVTNGFKTVAVAATALPSRLEQQHRARLRGNFAQLPGRL
jgi:hypothetical protein